MIKARGIVKLAIKREDSGDRTILIEVTPEEVERIKKLSEIDDKCDNPIKFGTEEDDGKLFFKAHTKYDIDIYENAEITEEVAFTDIGRGSEVELAVTIKDGKYKGKKYQSAYLKAVNIIDFVQAEEYNPFTEPESTVKGK